MLELTGSHQGGRNFNCSASPCECVCSADTPANINKKLSAQITIKGRSYNSKRAMLC